MPCPCYSGKLYQECCQPFHDGRAFPCSPEELMRSRYAAYAKGLSHYIMDTTHPSSPSYRANRITWEVEILGFCNATSFTGLEIVETDGATVSFVAHLVQDGRDASFREKSRFEKVDGRWLYLSGE